MPPRICGFWRRLGDCCARASTLISPPIDPRRRYCRGAPSAHRVSRVVDPYAAGSRSARHRPPRTPARFPPHDCTTSPATARHRPPASTTVASRAASRRPLTPACRRGTARHSRSGACSAASHCRSACAAGRRSARPRTTRRHGPSCRTSRRTRGIHERAGQRLRARQTRCDNTRLALPWRH